MFPQHPSAGPNRLPKPGQGMDPMMAMLGGLGPMMASPPPGGPISGPDGLPIGGSAPPPGANTGNSPLLAALLGGPQAVLGGPPPGQGPIGGGDGDPGPGIEQLLQLMALAHGGGGEGGPAGAGPLGRMMG